MRYVLYYNANKYVFNDRLRATVRCWARRQNQ